MKTIAFFNNKGGVGKTSLAYHLTWMFAERGLRVVAADLDPQANLTSMFLDEDRLETLWPDIGLRSTILGSIEPLFDGTGDVGTPRVERFYDNRICLFPGDLGMSKFEDDLSQSWPRCLEGHQRSFRVTTAFFRSVTIAASEHDADLALIDVGPNLGAINRAALLAADHVVIPIGPDLFSLQGLRNLDPTLRQWRLDRQHRLEAGKGISFPLPKGEMLPAGYVMMRHSIRLDRPVKA